LNILEQVKIASNPENAVNQSDFIILMLQNSQIVRDVCQSNIFPYDKSKKNNRSFNLLYLIRTAKTDTFIIDCSTIDIRTSKEMFEMARQKQLHFVDAPVSGGSYCTYLLFNLFILIGVIGAQKGTLTFMVGAELNDFKSVESILAKMGKNVVHAGPNGSGLAAKICNNLLAAIR
jgi:3-hydroxyisobutyrate dehydrogenase